jgi:hypothetical protein
MIGTSPKFAQQGGTVGLMTGGVLALYLIGVIVTDTQRQEQQATSRLLPPPASVMPAQPAGGHSKPNVLPAPQIASPPTARPTPPITVQPPPPPEPRSLLASKGAVLKFVAGITYHLKVRTGFTSSLIASRGTVAFYAGDERIGECLDALELSMPKSGTPYAEVDRTIRACGSDAIMRVGDVR